MKEKTADEMFEELGYKKYYPKDKEVYDNGITYKNKKRDKYFNFSCINKRVGVATIRDFLPDYIELEELQAINKKCKELGWLDE